jgi:hypothetical protein
MRRRLFLASLALIPGVARPAGAQEIPPYGAIPPPRREVVPPPPGTRYIWEPGHWHWNGRAYVWFRGHYVIRQARWGEYVPGHWDHRGPNWVWVPAHWR